MISPNATFLLRTAWRRGIGESNRPSAWNASAVNGSGYFLAAVAFAAASAYFFVKRSTRPAVSTSFCLPVKNGWQLEQISTRRNSPLMVERVGNVCPQAQCTVTAWYSGWMPGFLKISGRLAGLHGSRSCAGSTAASLGQRTIEHDTRVLPLYP